VATPSPTEIFVRAYTEKPGAKPLGSKQGAKGNDEPSEWALVFDCETTVDAAQRLRVGFFQVRKSGELMREGVFYDPEALSEADLGTLASYATAQRIEALPVALFRTEVFLTVGYLWRGAIVGFNLSFDLSRIAIDHGPARGSMRGGFTFKLTPDTRDPAVRVKHLSARAALIDFAAPAKQETPRGMRRRGLAVRPHRGFFIDLKTLAAALTSRSFSLGRLAKFLGTETQKLEADDHGGPLTEGYLDYARADVQASWECYEALLSRYEDHGLDAPAHRILSEASVGKSYLKQMGIQPLLGYQPDIPRAIFGIIMGTYFGGRAEVRIRRVITQVLYCDFKSMYPTVNALMGLWQFAIADQLSWHDATTETQDLLKRITIADLQKPDTWRSLRVLVRLKPDHDVLPVRAKYDGKINTIGLNYLSCREPLWYTLADCVASKMLTGKTPIIDEAIRFEPGKPQDGLKPINLFGREDFRIDPRTDDFFTRLIDLRDDAKAKGDPVEKAIKIVANSTSYGIFVEVNRDDAPKPEPLDVYGPDGRKHVRESTGIEEPGRYYHPLLGTLITGAARLMLATAEALAADRGLGWAFCDTDSIAMARPSDMTADAFTSKTQEVIDWFEALNPYQQPGSILKIEDGNFGIKSGLPEPLYCLAISAKRYALFNIDRDGRPMLRKASAHGLGHLMVPYDDHQAPSGMLLPATPLATIGVKRWQHDLWIKIIEATMSGKPNQLAFDWHPAFQKPALSRYSATSPKLLGWMDSWNDGKAYENRVRPFGFLVSFMARTGAFAEGITTEIVDPTRRGRPLKSGKPKPIAPFERDHDKAANQAFNRESGERVAPCLMKTYAEALAQFHLSTEDKFDNGDFYDAGTTKRRYVMATGVSLIGKEANRVGSSGECDPISSGNTALFMHLKTAAAPTEARVSNGSPLS
jgi:hypothetical protein